MMWRRFYNWRRVQKMSDSIRSRIVGSYREDEKYREGLILYQPLMNLWDWKAPRLPFWDMTANDVLYNAARLFTEAPSSWNMGGLYPPVAAIRKVSWRRSPYQLLPAAGQSRIEMIEAESRIFWGSNSLNKILAFSFGRAMNSERTWEKAWSFGRWIIIQFHFFGMCFSFPE